MSKNLISCHWSRSDSQKKNDHLKNINSPIWVTFAYSVNIALKATEKLKLLKYFYTQLDHKNYHSYYNIVS